MKKSLRYALVAILLCVLSALSGAAVDVFVKPKKASATFEDAAKWAAGVGRVVGKDERSGMFRIRLLPGKDRQQAIVLLSKRKGVASARPAPALRDTELVDTNSVSSIKRRIAKIKKEWKRGGKPKTGALGAFLQYVRERAYPYDRIDWEALQRASVHRDRMPAARIGRTRNSRDAKAAGFGTWEYVGPNNLDIPYRVYYGIRPLAGRINAIAYNPVNQDTIYLAGATGGLWKSVDHGVTWACLSDQWEKMPVASIAIDPKNAQIVYAGTGDYHGGSGYSFGLMKSTDGGVNWTNLGRSTFGDVAVSAILVDPTDTQNLICVGGRGSAGNGRVYRSTNGGTTWTTAVNVWASWCDADYGAPSGGKRTYYAVAGGGGGQIYRSEDSGATWAAAGKPSGATLNGTVDVAASKVDPATVYLLSTSDEAIYKSTDRGSTWTDVTNNHPGDYNWSQGWYDYHITTGKRGSSDLVFTGLIDIVCSDDGGATWESIGGPTYSGAAITHNDQHSMAVNPNNANEILIGNDGGIFLYTFNTGTQTWSSTPLNRALGTVQFYRAAWHPTDEDIMIGGTQDNATPQVSGDLLNWNCVGGGDGGGCAINPVDPRIQYCTVYNLNVYRTGNTWVSSESISPDIGNDNAPFISQISIDPSNPRYLYGGTNYLYRWDDVARTWTARLGGQKLSDDVVSTIAVAPSDSAVIYVGTGDGRVWRTGNGGTNWTQINGGLPNRYIGYISVNRSNPNSILVGLSGTGTAHVWRCTDASATSRTWSAIDGSGVTRLPDIPVSAIARDYRDNDNTLFVATDVGVFMTTNGGQTWGNATNVLGLPNVQVNDLAITPSNNYLFAATWGRGMWRMKLPTEPVGLTAVAVNPNSVVGGTTTVGSVSLDTDAPPGGMRVSLTSSNTKAATVPGFIIVPSGETTGTFQVRTLATANAAAVTITAKLGQAVKTAGLSVNPPGVQGLTMNPATVVSGNSSTGTIVLSSPADAGGQIVTVAVDNAKVASVPWQVVIPEGETTGTFTVTTVPVSKTTLVRVRAASPGPTKYATLTLTPTIGLSRLALSPTSVKSGRSAKGTIALTGPAVSDLIVTITSSDPSTATPPTTVKIARGAKSAVFAIGTTKVRSRKTVTISCTYGGVTLERKLTVNP